jgi:hypothetical protein
MQPDVATGETTTFPSTVSALTDDAPHVQGAWSRPAPVACADLNASTATTAPITAQTAMTERGPQNLTARGCRAVIPSTMGRVTHLRPRRSHRGARPGDTDEPSTRLGRSTRLASLVGHAMRTLPSLRVMAERATSAENPAQAAFLLGSSTRVSRHSRANAARGRRVRSRRTRFPLRGGARRLPPERPERPALPPPSGG